MGIEDKIVRTPLFPLYAEVRICMRAWDGVAVQTVRDMINSISALTGTPQDPVDWSDPDHWIAERLFGKDRMLAEKIWNSGLKTVNPRYTYGCYLFINSQNLLENKGRIYELSRRGQAFLDNNPETVFELDRSEGLPRILALVAQKNKAKRSDLLEDWSNYLLQVSNFSKPSTFKDSLRRRLANLTDRGLIDREGNSYNITKSGRNYLKQWGEPLYQDKTAKTEVDVATTLADHNDRQRRLLKQKLMALSPYAFEHFVKELLEAMDYENVTVTKQSGDKGVDVTANFQFGITEIKEVVQVKRTEASITRPVIDQLRGALPYHQAIRGTIITLGKFAKGVADSALFQGAAPITLIDGDRLIALAEKHGVGLRDKTLVMLEINEAFFTDSVSFTGSEEDMAGAGQP